MGATPRRVSTDRSGRGSFSAISGTRARAWRRLVAASWSRPPWWAAAGGVAVAIAVLLDVLNGGLLVSLDHCVARVTREWDLRDRAYGALYPLTWFGQRGPVLLVSVPLAVWLSCRARSAEPLARLAIALALLTASVYALKYGVGRDAPPVDGVHTGAGGTSFPSGHVANATLVWGLLAWLCARDARVRPKPLPWRIVGVAGAVRWIAPFAVVAGMTLLGFHWISDFIAGAGIGIALLWAVTLPAPSGRGARALRLSAER